jgi:hypothetical protein
VTAGERPELKLPVLGYAEEAVNKHDRWADSVPFVEELDPGECLEECSHGFPFG